MKKYFLLLTTLFAFSFSFSQSFNKQKLDSLFSLINANDKGMGSISIFSDGKEVYSRSIGYADVEKKLPLNNETGFRIGSISKTFTAVIILQMIDEKKFSLDTKLSEFFPSIPSADSITIEHLLRHRSGIHNFTDDQEYETWMEKPQSREEMLKKISSFKREFPAGQKFSYSNSNYVILSMIAEKADKNEYPAILNARIIKPLGLSRTSYMTKINTSDNMAMSYRRDGSDWKPATETDPGVPIGAGGIVSTAHDLNVFLYAIFNGKLISRELFEKMKTIVEGYGLGLGKYPYHDYEIYGHSGGIDGFQSFAGYFPAQKVNIAYLTNAVGMARNDIIVGALDIYFGRDYKFPEFKPAVTLKAEDLANFPGVYSKEGFPINLTILLDGNNLLGQGSGQASFPLTATGKLTFINEAAGINIRFEPDGRKLYLKQGSLEIEMVKESQK